MPSPTNHFSEALSSMLDTLDSVDGHLGTLNNQLAGFTDKKYPTNHSREIEELQHKLLVHAKKNEVEVIVAKKTIRDDLKTRIGESLREHVRDSIKTEVAAQVQREVEMQIQDYIPMSLARQAVDIKKGIADAKIALANSEARVKNTSIHADDQDEPLMPILKSDGTRSEWFPADLRSLSSYDDDHVRRLVRDYDLLENSPMETSLNQFMRHIG